MKIVVTDACIFIDVIKLNLTAKFFGLELEVHTTVDVINELYPSQQQILEGYISSKRLTVHLLTGEEQLELINDNHPKGLSPEDLSVIFIARKLQGSTVLSSDKKVREYAKKHAIQYHGMLWIVDQLVTNSLILKREGVKILDDWINSNRFVKENLEIKEEANKMKRNWK
jgi:predicted nucleic acid-binding protein